MKNERDNFLESLVLERIKILAESVKNSLPEVYKRMILNQENKDEK